MKAVGYTAPGPIERPDALIDLEMARPRATGRDLLVRIAAVSVNPIDCKIRKRRAPPDGQPAILGWDGVGEIVEIGDRVNRFKPGARVWYAGAIDRPGTNAEYHLVDERIVGCAPGSVANAAAAALPLTTLTAYEMLFDRLRVHEPVPGAADAILVIGGAGGVGSIAIQLLRAMSKLTVIATASRPRTQEWTKALGAHHVIDHTKPLPPQIAALKIGAPGFVFSTTHSHTYAHQVAELIMPQGRFGLIDDPEGFDILAFKAKAVSLHWESMFARALFETPDIARQGEILDEVAKLLDAGQIKSTATQTLERINAANLMRAHSIIESGKARGKLVLEGF